MWSKLIFLFFSLVVVLGNGYAQYHPFPDASDVGNLGVLELNQSELLVFGSENNGEVDDFNIFTQHGFLSIYDRVTESWATVEIGGPPEIARFWKADFVGDSIRLIASAWNDIELKEVPVLMFLDANFNLISWKWILYPRSVDYIFDIKSAQFAGEFVLAITEYDIEASFSFPKIDFILMNLTGEILKQGSINNQINNGIFSCTSISKGISDPWVFTLYSSVTERVFSLGVDLSPTFQKSLPYLDQDFPISPGYTYYHSFGSNYTAEGVNLSIRKEIWQGFDSQTLFGVVLLDENYDISKEVIMGKSDNQNFLGGYTKGLTDNYFVVGTDELYGSNYPPAHWTSTLYVGNLSYADSIIWETTFSNETFFFPTQIIPLSQGGCLVIGDEYKEGETDYRDVFLLFIDENGQVSSLTEVPHQRTTLFPNPTNTGKINLPQELKGQVSHLIITDLTGRIITSQNWNGEELTLPTGTPPGLYSVRGLKNGELVFVERLVVE